MRIAFLFAFIGLMLAACAPQHRTAHLGGQGPDGHSQDTPVEGVTDFALASPVVYRNLTLIPVVTTKPVDDDKLDYLSLDEAKKNGWVEIFELPGNEEVNRLQVRNKGPRPLLLLAGQLLIGGKQDRIVGKDTVVPAGETIDVPVYCVEHGRWSGSSEHFEYGGTQVPGKVKASAMFRGQQEVWNDVADYNAKAAAPADGTTIQGGLNSDKTRATIEQGFARLRDALSKDKRVVGFVVCIDGQITGMELFGGPSLFRSSSEGLVKGALADAAASAGEAQVSAPMDEAKRFVQGVFKSRREVAANSRDAGMAARSANDPTLLSIDHEDIVGQEKTETPATAKSAEDRTLIHGSYGIRR